MKDESGVAVTTLDMVWSERCEGRSSYRGANEGQEGDDRKSNLTHESSELSWQPKKGNLSV